jgi:hypothetical protein
VAKPAPPQPFSTVEELRAGEGLDGASAGEKGAKLAQKLGQLQPFHSCVPAGMYGPTYIFWANLTPLSPQWWTRPSKSRAYSTSS